MTPGDTVVLIPGLWMPGWELLCLAGRLRGFGFDTVVFRYATVRAGVVENSARLGKFLEPYRASARAAGFQVHLVGHSLGGLVALTFLVHQGGDGLGRMVALGTPFQGSISARRMARSRMGRFFLGKSLEGGLAGGMPREVQQGGQVGVIAGTLALGGGRMLGPLPQPNDGTVAVAETRLHGAAHRLLPVTHSGMLFSRAVPVLIRRFLETGRFD